MEKNYEIVTFRDGEFTLDVRADFTKNQETAWLTQEEIAKLFEVDRTRITRRINNIYEDHALDETTTSAENAHMGSLGLQSYKTRL